MRKSTENLRIVLDTNVLFSAIRYRGKPFELLERAERENVKVLIPEYVYEELREVFIRNDLDFNLVVRFLATYENLSIVERKFRGELIALAEEMVPDRKDHPVFAYTLLLHEEDNAIRLVTGDKSLREALNRVKEGLALSVDEALSLLK
ncbi:MAG: PIN domain-containing protein [Archaeoglobus sp.]|nr:PIN domain-containing protein [Archaeoglobus sp.]